MEKATKYILMGAAVLALAIGALIYRDWQRGRADDAVVALRLRAERVLAADSALRSVLEPKVDSTLQLVAQLKQDQQAIKTHNLYIEKRNENLNKQLDSINGILGLRPDF